MDKERVINKCVRDYKRQQTDDRNINEEEEVVIEPNNLDELCDDMCDELINQLHHEAKHNTCKAIIFKCFDNGLYLSSHLISLTILILGLYGGATDSGNTGNNKSVWFFITAILGGVNGLLVELGKRYDFKSRSRIIYKCAQDLDEIIITLRELKVDPTPAEQKMVIIKETETKIKEIQMKSFDSQVIKDTPPTEITSVTK